VALSVGNALKRIPPAVSRHAVLWRPDFPPPFRSDHPPGKPITIMPHLFLAMELLMMSQEQPKVSFFWHILHFGSILLVVLLVNRD
jgi:hypothetical protein